MGLKKKTIVGLLVFNPLWSSLSKGAKGDASYLVSQRKCFFYFRRNTEFFEKHTEFRGIFTVKFSRNSAEFRMYLHTEFRSQLNDPNSRFQSPKNTVGVNIQYRQKLNIMYSDYYFSLGLTILRIVGLDWEKKKLKLTVYFISICIQN